MRSHLLAFVLLTSVLAPTARADGDIPDTRDAQPAQPAPPQPAPPAPMPVYTQPDVPVGQPLEQPAAPVIDESRIPDKVRRAKFSGGRYLVEVLVGAAAGSLAFYATYSGLCSGNPGDDCVGALLAGAGANLVAMPIAQWGVGNAMGGEGSLAWTYYGEALTFSAAPAGGQGLAIASLLMPFVTALGYEASSNKWFMQHRGQLEVMPVGGPHGTQASGALAGVSLSF